MAIGVSYWGLTLLGPALMLYLFLKVTGIPPTEARALQTRGDDYRAYQRTTSAFFPWFPKKS
jgi:steroid 5-alpha reductase family enzyme